MPTLLKGATLIGEAKKIMNKISIYTIKLTFASFLLLSISQKALAGRVEGGSGKAYGERHSYHLTAPKGWVIDDESAQEQGVPLVFYPVGSSWTNSHKVIYTRPRDIDGNISTIDDVVKSLVTDFHQNGSPNYRSEFKQNVSLPNRHTAKIYWFSGDRYGNYEAVAYIKERKTINFIVLNAKNKQDFLQSLPAFTVIVKSYRSTN
jgi:hypothetical protein